MQRFEHSTQVQCPLGAHVNTWRPWRHISPPFHGRDWYCLQFSFVSFKGTSNPTSFSFCGSRFCSWQGTWLCSVLLDMTLNQSIHLCKTWGSHSRGYVIMSYVPEGRSRNSSAGIATGYGLDWPGSTPGRARFFSSPQHPDRFCGSPSLLSDWYRG
jgi:hypothetical protein